MYTLFGCGLSGNLEAQVRNISGAGFPFFTSGSDAPVTTWLKSENNGLCLEVLTSKFSLALLVATANGTLLL